MKEAARDRLDRLADAEDLGTTAVGLGGVNGILFEFYQQTDSKAMRRPAAVKRQGRYTASARKPRK
jgi:predicted amino acid dehydrogenase